MSAQEFHDEHTLAPPTSPKHVHQPSAYGEDNEGRVRIDPSAAVLVTAMRSCIITNEESEPGVAFQLHGVVGKEQEEVSITHVASLSSIARIVSQLIELGVATGEESAMEFHEIMRSELARQASNHKAYMDDNRDVEEA